MGEGVDLGNFQVCDDGNSLRRVHLILLFIPRQNINIIKAIYYMKTVSYWVITHNYTKVKFSIHSSSRTGNSAILRSVAPKGIKVIVSSGLVDLTGD